MKQRVRQEVVGKTETSNGKGEKEKEREKGNKKRMHNGRKELGELRARRYCLSVLYYGKWERTAREKLKREGKKERGEEGAETDEEKCRERKEKKGKSHAQRTCLPALCLA